MSAAVKAQPMAPSPAYASLVALIERCLSQTLTVDAVAAQSPHAPVLHAMAYATLGGGKRLRGALAVASADLCAVARDQSVRLGAAIECMHAYSLVHDDLPAMDDSPLRRGKPSVHRAFGEATAILAGDGLQALAFELAAGAGLDARGIAAFARAVGRAGMVGGQMHDMRAEAGELPPNTKALEALHAAKTGALIQFSALAGPLLAQDTTHEPALADYGAKIGLAFQIWDDVMDAVGDSTQTGKPTGQDQNKMTFVSLLGLADSKTKAQTLIESAKAQLPPGPQSTPLIEIADFAIHWTS